MRAANSKPGPGSVAEHGWEVTGDGAGLSPQLEPGWVPVKQRSYAPGRAKRSCHQVRSKQPTSQRPHSLSLLTV